MSNQQHLIPEENVPSNLVPVEAAPINPSMMPAPPMPTEMPTFFTGSIAPQLQHDGSFVGTESGSPRVPKISLMPLGTQSSAFTNAAAQSTSRLTVVETSGGGSSSSQQITLDIPSQFTPTSQTVTLPGPLSFAWATEPNGTFFGVSSQPGAPFPDASISNSSESASVTSTVVTGPTASNLLFYFAARETSGTGLSAPTGGSWTNVVTAANLGGWYQSGFSANTAVSETATYTPSASPSVVNALISFPITGSPTVGVVGAGHTGSITSGLTTTGTVTAGQALLSYVIGDMHGHSGTIPDTDVVAITDSNNNIWYQITAVYQWNGLNHSSFISIWFCPKPAAGSTTFTINFSLSAGSGGSSAWAVLGISNLAPSNNLPTFRYISFSDIQGIASVAQGGTGSSLVNTGGTHMFLRQNTAGGNVDVVQPDFSDLAGAAGQIAGQYNGVTTQGNGLAAIYKSENLTSQTANVGVSTLLPVTLLSGIYRVSVYTIVTTAGGVSSTLPDSQIIFVDRDSGATITINATPGNTGNTLSTFQQTTLVINVKASTTIQFAIGQVTPYASSGTAMQFAYRARVEYLG